MAKPMTSHPVSLLDWGCGMTLDLFWNTPESTISVQWLWALPTDHLSGRGLDEDRLLDRVVDVIMRVGFQPIDTGSGPLRLPNGYSHEESCPFAASDCNGQHLVISGAGLVDEGRVREFVARVGGLLSDAGQPIQRRATTGA